MHTVEVDLRSLFSLDPDQSDALDSFISQRLIDANVWDSFNSSDGIVNVRIVECEPERLRICGRIYSIDQELHSFWLNLVRTASGGVTWALYFDVVASSPRRERNAIDMFDEAEEIDWRVTLSGQGEVRDGTLVIT